MIHEFTRTNMKGAKGQQEDRPNTFNVEISRLMVEEKIQPIIIVLPDGSSRYGGSIYTNSITTGNWEDYIVSDLVSFINKTYRTLARSESRGIAGHWMGVTAHSKLR